MTTLLRLVSLNVARLLFVGGLLLALYLGLDWALSPQDRPDASAVAGATEAGATEAPPPPTPTETTPAGPPATPTPIPVAPAELIAAAAPPADTTVQVLDAGGGGANVDAAVSALEQLGYQIVARSPSSRKVTQTTVYWVGEGQPEAEGLRARDPRFRQVEDNADRLSQGVDLHVLVGPDF